VAAEALTKEERVEVEVRRQRFARQAPEELADLLVELEQSNERLRLAHAAEVERLRAALEAVVEEIDGPCGFKVHLTEETEALCRAALAPLPEVK